MEEDSAILTFWSENSHNWHFPPPPPTLRCSQVNSYRGGHRTDHFLTLAVERHWRCWFNGRMWHKHVSPLKKRAGQRLRSHTLKEMWTLQQVRENEKRNRFKCLKAQTMWNLYFKHAGLCCCENKQLLCQPTWEEADRGNCSPSFCRILSGKSY